MTGLLENKSIVVTGGSSGIGAAICKAVCEAGGNVLIHGRREAVLKEMASRLGSSVAYVTADL